MKNKKIILNVLGIFAFVVGLLLFNELAELLLNGITLAVAGAGATVVGTVTTTKSVGADGTVEQHDINAPTISQKITKIYPSQYPMDTILREINSVKCKSFEYKYYSVNGRGVRSKITTAYTAVGGDSSRQAVAVGNIGMFSLDCNILFPEFEVNNETKVATRLSSGRALNPLVCHVVTVDNLNDKLLICPLNAALLPSLPADTIILRMGTAKHELAAISSDPVNMPYNDMNYCQIHMATVSEGFYQKLQDKDVQFGLTDMREQAIFDFRMMNEAGALFGVRSEFLDPIANKVKYMSDGILRKINKRLDMGSTSKVTNDMLFGWAADIFCGNNGSETRIMFYGKEFGKALGGSATFEKQLEANKTEVVFGITFQKLTTPYGTILMKPHDLLNEYDYGNTGIVIDPANVYRAELKALESTTLELNKTGISRADTIRMDEAHCLAVTNPDTHAIIQVK